MIQIILFCRLQDFELTGLYKTRQAFLVVKQQFATLEWVLESFQTEICVFYWVPLFFSAPWWWASQPLCPARTCCGLWIGWMSISCWANGCWTQAAWAVGHTRRGSKRGTPPTSSSSTTPLDFPFTVISASVRPVSKSTPTSRWLVPALVLTTSTTPSPSCGRLAQTVSWRTSTLPLMGDSACTCSAEEGRSSQRTSRSLLLSLNVSACFLQSWMIRLKSFAHTQSECKGK